MELRLELLKGEIADIVNRNIDKLEIDVNEIAQSTAVRALNDIKAVINNTELDDFMMVDEIVEIFYKYGIETGGTHDF